MAQTPQAFKLVYPHSWGMTDHTLNANNYALAALRERRAEMSGHVTKLEGQIRTSKRRWFIWTRRCGYLIPIAT